MTTAERDAMNEKPFEQVISAESYREWTDEKFCGHPANFFTATMALVPPNAKALLTAALIRRSLA